jgi:hypothetical protein
MSEVRPSLNVPQSRFMAMPHKYRAFVAGFGSGKTWVGCSGVCSHFWQFPRINAGYFAPTYPQIRDIFYPTMEEVAFNWGLRVTVREVNKEVHVYSGRQYRGTVLCRSMEKPETIVGFKIGHALVDELDVLKAEKAKAGWRKIIARMRYKVDGLKNGIDVTTTPEGFRFVHGQWVQEVSENPDLRGLYGMVQASTYDNELNLPDDYISSLLASYPAQLIAAYLRGQFVNLTSGSVYPLFDRWHNGTDELILPREALHIGMDFNVGQMTAKVSVIRGDDPLTLDELVGVLDTPSMIEALREKYVRDGRKADQITIYPDAAGGSRDTRNASSSDLALLRNAGFRVLAPPSNPPIRDRVVSVNAMICNGKGERRWKVNPKTCPRLVQDMEQQAYDANGMPDKSAGNDHGPDALGYFMHSKFPAIRTSRPKVDKTVPQGVKPFSVEWMTHGTQS